MAGTRRSARPRVSVRVLPSPMAGVSLVQLGGHFDGIPRGWTWVDDADVEFVLQWRWSLLDGYARRTARDEHGRQFPVFLHRELLGLAPGDPRETDHRDRCRVHNRRCNLRVVTHAQNCQNTPSRRGSTSHYRGVRWNRTHWQAFTHRDGEFVHLGMFADENEAGRVAAEARRECQPFAEAA